MRAENKAIILNDKILLLMRKYVSNRGSDRCSFWTGSKLQSSGYGQMTIWTDRYTQEHYLAHRVAYVMAYGPFDWNLLVCHTCDCRLCCNPEHLFLGTMLDNSDDRASKGRRVGMNPIISDEIVRAIRYQRSLGQTQISLSEEFNIPRRTIRGIINYERRETV